MLLRLVAGIAITTILICVFIVVGRPCRFVAFCDGLIWGGALGPALSAGLFIHLRHRMWLKSVLRAFLVGVVALFAMLVVVPNTTGAIQRGRRVKTMADMREIGRQIESGITPSPAADPWGGQYIVTYTAGGYTIVSYGECGEPDIPPGQSYSEVPTGSATDDLVYSNGHFVRWPGAEAN